MDQWQKAEQKQIHTNTEKKQCYTAIYNHEVKLNIDFKKAKLKTMKFLCVSIREYLGKGDMVMTFEEDNKEFMKETVLYCPY